MSFGRFYIPVPLAAKLGRQSHRAFLLPARLLPRQDALPRADIQLQRKISACSTMHTFCNPRDFSLQYSCSTVLQSKTETKWQFCVRAVHISLGLYNTVDGIIFMRAVSQFGYISGKRLNGTTRSAFGLHLHVPIGSKTLHGLCFHEIKWRNKANECCCCERRLMLLWKQILILHNFLHFDPLWWKRRGRQWKWDGSGLLIQNTVAI